MHPSVCASFVKRVQNQACRCSSAAQARTERHASSISPVARKRMATDSKQREQIGYAGCLSCILRSQSWTRWPRAAAGSGQQRRWRAGDMCSVPSSPCFRSHIQPCKPHQPCCSAPAASERERTEWRGGTAAPLRACCRRSSSGAAAPSMRFAERPVSAPAASTHFALARVLPRAQGPPCALLLRRCVGDHARDRRAPGSPAAAAAGPAAVAAGPAALRARALCSPVPAFHRFFPP